MKGYDVLKVNSLLVKMLKQLIQSQNDIHKQTSINVSPLKNSDPELSFESTQIREVSKIDTKYGFFKAPIPNRHYTKQWDEVITHQVQTDEKIQCIKEFEKVDFEFQTKIAEYVCALPLPYKEIERTRIVKKCLTVLIAEKLLHMKVDQMIENLSTIEATQDEACSGLWLTSRHAETQGFPRRNGTNAIPVSRKYKFDAITTEHLIQMTFTQDDEVRAKAKFSLSSRLETTIHQEVIQDSSRVLEINFAEVCLLFPKSKKE
jgi:hypothetical protein